MGYGTSVYDVYPRNSYDWCFDGEPTRGIVAVSSVGTQNNAESKRLFLQGYEEMMRRLSPSWVIFYGKVPVECDWNVIQVQSHGEQEIKRKEREAVWENFSAVTGVRTQ